MTSYPTLKGRSLPTAPAAAPDPAAAVELSETEMERIDANRHFIHAHMPEMIPVIKDLMAAGLVTGWRNVENCRLLPASQEDE